MSVTIAELCARVANGRVFEIGRPLEAGIPGLKPHPSFFFSLFRRHGDATLDEGVSTANDVFLLGGHVGTHIDAIGHVSRQEHLYGGEGIFGNQPGAAGLRVHGIETMGPVIARGVLIDMAPDGGVLPDGHEVLAADLESACDRQGTVLQPDDVVLVRTGWGRYWSNPAKYTGTDGRTAGVGLEATDWLVAARPRAVGADNATFEPYEFPPTGLPVHGRLIADNGVPIIEMLDLDELADAKAYEFLFLALPLRISGATGSPIRPVAIT